MQHKHISDLRQEYDGAGLLQAKLTPDPFALFEQWLSAVLALKSFEPTAMVLATVDEQGFPNTRVVLLKAISDKQFVFYSNYQSTKGQELLSNPKAALNFYWPTVCQQIRVRGIVTKIPSEQSDQYFASRPRQSQASAIISQQSTPLDSRERLEEDIATFQGLWGEKPYVRPEHWGGYALTPSEFEFWQGRKHRLHDRFRYVWCEKTQQWLLQRLSP